MKKIFECWRNLVMPVNPSPFSFDYSSDGQEEVLAILARFTILALIDVTSFPAIHLLYLAPAFLLFLVFISLSWGWSLESLLKKRPASSQGLNSSFSQEPKE